ncbi:MAG: response regulator [Candidatus Zixiibacteriota bacterium]
MKKILVVDDEPDILRLYSSELEDEGYHVRLASDGEEAERIVNSENVDLVVLDIKMQKKDGLATLTQLKRIKKELPIVLNSAYPVFKSDFQSWLADYYVVKSSNLEELKKKINQILKHDKRSEN